MRLDQFTAEVFGAAQRSVRVKNVGCNGLTQLNTPVSSRTLKSRMEAEEWVRRNFICTIFLSDIPDMFE